jgi:hypothetical protein
MDDALKTNSVRFLCSLTHLTTQLMSYDAATRHSASWVAAIAAVPTATALPEQTTSFKLAASTMPLIVRFQPADADAAISG